MIFKKSFFLVFISLTFVTTHVAKSESQIKITKIRGINAPEKPLADTSMPDIVLDASTGGEVNTDIQTIGVPDGTKVKIKFKNNEVPNPPEGIVKDSKATIPFNLEAGYTKVIYAETEPFIQPPMLPNDIGGLKLWLKADAISHVGNNAPISTWNDDSGNGNNVSTNIESQKPIYIENVLNGFPVVRWDENNDDVLKTTSDIIDETKKHTIYAVAKLRSSSENIAALFSDNSNSLFSGICCSGDKGWRMWTPTFQSFSVNSASEGFKYYTFIIRATTNKDDTVTLSQNNTSISNGGYHTRETGSSFWIGGTPNSSTQGWDGDIAEILVYEGEHTTEQIDRIEGYLKEKYGL